jgi:RHS repeat-associated protein
VGDAVQYTFDDANHPLTRIVGEGTEQVETRYVYDANGMVTSKTEAFGTSEQRVTSYAYAKSNWPSFATSITETSVAKPGQSKVTSFSWNAAETELTQSISGYLASTDGAPTVHTTLTTFDARHRMTSQDGPVSGQQKTWSYYADADASLNRRGRLQQVTVKTTPTSTLTTTYDDYDVYGTPRLETDANLVETRRTLDGRGRTLTAVSVKPAGDANEAPDYVTTSSYDLRDRLTSLTQPLGNKMTYQYEDGTNRLLQTIRVDAGGDERERVVYTLNAIGGKTNESYEECTTPAASCSSWVARKTEAFAYDAHGRLSTITHLDATTIAYAYDTRGNLVSVKDERHSVPNTIYTYDSLDRLESVTQKRTLEPGADVITSYDYDAQDNLTVVTDPNSNATSYAYDDFGRLQKQTSPVTGVTGYSYDQAGSLLTTTDANNATTTRTYDLMNRVLTATSARSGQVTEVVKWGYDDLTSASYGRGRLASMSDPAGVTTYKYDRRGLLRQESRLPAPCKSAPLTCTSSRSTLVSTYGHDANGNRTSIGYPSAKVVTYGFDHANRPLSATSDATSLISSASYLPFGPLRTLVFGNGTSQTFTHDTRYLPLTHQVLTGSTPLASYIYDHDGAGNITEIHDALDATWNRDFAYDDLNRLTTATGGASLWGAGSYIYDAMGNLLSSTLGSTSTAFDYSSTTPKLTTVTTTGQPPVSVTYDNAGNELQSASTQNISPRNLVSSIATLATRLANAYDGRGVRVESKSYPPPPADWTSLIRHIYSPELRPLARYQYDNYLGLPRLQHVTDYVWFGDRPVAQLNVTASTLAYTAADHLGTPFLQTDTTATVVWRAEYDPYGTIHQMHTGNESDQPLRFPGQEVVGSVTERYNIFRWYRNGWGRYTQADPVHGPRLFLKTGRVIPPAANPDGDQYPYTGGNPIRFTDPDGLYTRPCSPGDWSNCQSDCDKIGKRLVGCGCYGVALCFGLLDYSVAACKDYQKGCPPCPPPTPPIRVDKVPQSPPHFPCKGDHWHYQRVDQGPPPTCICRYTWVLGGCL